MHKSASRSIIRLCPIVLAVWSALPALAQDASHEQKEETLPVVTVTALRNKQTQFSTSATSDSSTLLNGTPGYTTAFGGGVSSVPVVNGFADDRLKILVDGIESTAACGNHMNPPLSYISPKMLGQISLYSGVTPVSLGGDSIGGTIDARSPSPVFAENGDHLLTEGIVSVSSRSVDHSLSLGLGATLASDTTSLSYSGSKDRGQSYKDGNDNKVLGSMYESQSNQLSLAVQGDRQQIVVRAGDQRIPYQGFPNEYMDMTLNRAQNASASYTRNLSWGDLEARIYWQDTRHEMGFFSAERIGTMPMNTHGKNSGYAITADFATSSIDSFKVGNELHHYTLNDWWPAVSGSMMMGPSTYQNINNGRRDRMALFGEWNRKINAEWAMQWGLRDEVVKMNTGDVQSYGSMMMASDTAAAAIFNAQDHARTDNNLDFTTLARYTPASGNSFDFGFARKTRSPNLYERYSWGRSTMAMTMTNWFGDGNGYVGNLDLKPEVANTLSLKGNWTGAEQHPWNFTLNPYYSYVQNYIDADIIGSFQPYSISSASGNLLRFANHDATLYGLNASGFVPLLENSKAGQISLRAQASLTRGSRTDGNDLYRMMPLNGTIAVDQQIGHWTQTVETKLVAGKKYTDAQRLEIATGGYALLNLRTSYAWNTRLTISAGVSNVFDKAYSDPMGGVYLSGLKNDGSGPIASLPGYGRSLDIGMSLRF